MAIVKRASSSTASAAQAIDLASGSACWRVAWAGVDRFAGARLFWGFK